MRERDRTLSIQKKKLLKTTTFSVVLLSAVIMILSGSVSAINLNMNTTQMNDIIINNGDIVTQDMSDFTGGVDHSSPGWQGVKAMDKPLQYESSRAGYIVYDNEPTEWNYYVASYIDNVQYGWDELIADDFLMWTPTGEEWCIDDVHWMGVYYTPWTGGFNYDDESALDWVIEFFEDDGTGNAPGDLYAGPYQFTFDEIGTTLLGYEYSGSYLSAEFFDMSVDLPEQVCFPGCGEKFWISIHGLGDTYWLFTAVGMRDYDIFNNMADFKSDYYGYPDWVPTVSAYGIELELAFALTAKLDYDAMAISIDIDTSDFCGCVPVVATVKNDGKYDLQDVPVHVTITPGGYDETILVDLGVGEEIEVEFPDFCPDEWGTVEFTTICYTATVCTELAIDQYPANDCAYGAFCLDFPAFHDVGGVAVEITDDGCLNYEFCATIENFGQYQECCFKTYLYIEEATLTPGYDILFEDFEGGVPPAGWTSIVFPWSYGGWETNVYYGRTNYAGGSGMCADIDSDYVYGAGGQLISPMFDLSTAYMPTLEFIAAYNYLSGGEYFSVDLSTDGGFSYPYNLVYWQEDHGAYGPGELVSIDLSPYASSTCMLKFEYDDLGGWDWWCEVDDVHIFVDTQASWDVVYSDWYCIDTIDPCEQQTFCFDNSWTPTIGPNCEIVPYRATIKTEMCDPMDEVPGNDAYSKVFDVEFKHDIEVTITSPAPNKADLLFEQIVHDSTDTWSMGTSDAGLGYKMYENFWGLTDLIGEVTFDALALSWSGGWTAGDPATQTIDISFYADGTVPGAEVAYFADVPFTYIPGQVYSGFQAYQYHAVLPGVVDLTDGYVAVQTQSAAGENVILWCSAKTGDGFSYQEGASVPVTAYDRALKLWSGEGVSIAGYFPCGEMDLCANIANIGTFDEVDDPATVCDFEGIVAYYELHQYVQTDPCEDPEDIIIANGMEELELLCGEETEICFTYDFTEAGVYGLFMWADLYPVDLDCDLDNNLASMGFGIDCCAPISEHTLNPTMPDGCNNWYKQDVTVTITATDPLCPDPCLGTASGLKEIHYELNGVETVKEDDSVTFKISAQGVNLVEYWAVDNAGNEETHFTFEIAIDSVKPTVDLIFEKIEDGTLQVKFTAIASDATSGITQVEFFRDTTLLTTITSAPFTYTITWEDAFKTSTFKAVATDGACNTGEATVFGGDIPGAKAFANSVAQSLPQMYVHALTQNI